MSIFIQDMVGFVTLNKELCKELGISDEKNYKIEYLFDKEWKKVASLDYFRLFVDADKLDRICLLQDRKIVETFIPLRMTVLMYDKIHQKWTFSYLSGPVIENVLSTVEIKGWNGSEWLDFTLEETTEKDTNQLIPSKSSFLVSLKNKDNDKNNDKNNNKNNNKKILFHQSFKQTPFSPFSPFSPLSVCVCEWSMPDISNTRWVMNEILAPLAATSSIALITSVLFPEKIKDIKTALTWSIPGWLLLDGTSIFQQVMNGTTAQLNPIQVKVRDPSFWIKAVATGMGPLLAAVQMSGQNSEIKSFETRNQNWR